MWSNPHNTVDLVTFTEEIFNGKLHFLHSDTQIFSVYSQSILNDSVQGKNTKNMKPTWRVDGNGLGGILM